MGAGAEDVSAAPGSAGPPARGADVDDVAGRLVAFVNAGIMAPGRPVRPDDDLEAAGVDSMALLKVLLFVEAEFGFWMPEADLVDENLATARALARYVCRQRESS
jgi:acyl carrier protein